MEMYNTRRRRASCTLSPKWTPPWNLRVKDLGSKHTEPYKSSEMCT